MGQYHLILNLDRQQFLEPHAFGDGAKLMEFGTESQGMMTALAILLARDNGLGGGDLHLPENTPNDRRMDTIRNMVNSPDDFSVDQFPEKKNLLKLL